MAKFLQITSNASSNTSRPAVMADQNRSTRAGNFHSLISPTFNYRISLSSVNTTTICAHTTRLCGTVNAVSAEYSAVMIVCSSPNSMIQGETNERKAYKLKEKTRRMLEEVEEPLDKLELIDTIQRLGISYHFEHEINKILATFCSSDYKSSSREKQDLYAVALEFQLLRQHGFQVQQDVFNVFKDESGNFNASLSEDNKGMLYLYEASYLSFPGETILDEAKDFTAKHLKEMKLQQKSVIGDEDDELLVLIRRALDLPLRWRTQRMEARWFIDVYERRKDSVSTLLELAKLDFNMVQEEHQKDLEYLSSWWKSTGLIEKLSFARDRLMENFVWAMGMNFKPEFRSFIKMMTKIVCLVTVLDDIYDERGTLEELELFTDAIVRWEINGIERLPDYMKICFLAIYNCSNEIAYETLKEQDFCNISYLKDSWANLCKSYLLEAKWLHSGYTPTLEEYMKTATISVGGPLCLVHAYFSLTNPITKDALNSLQNYSHLIFWSSLIVRLSNDLGKSQDEVERVDNPKSIQCYMHEAGASTTEAREQLNLIIEEAWKNLNKFQVADSPFNRKFNDTAVNLAQIAQHLYRHGDGHGAEDSHTIMLLLMKPIPFS